MSKKKNSGGRRRMNPALVEAKRIARQADLYSDVLYDLVRDVFASGKPADRVIGALFRRSRRFGSKDRRFLNETFFALFRWAVKDGQWLSLSTRNGHANLRPTVRVSLHRVEEVLL